MRRWVKVVDHPLVQDGMAHLRNTKTDIERFRYYSDKVCQILFAEAIRGFDVRSEAIETPCGKTKVEKLVDDIVVVPVLRSGICMLPGAMWMLPKIKIGFVGMERDEETAVAREYYWKLPEVGKKTVVIVTDPMLATGGSILHLMKRMDKFKPKLIRVVCVVAAPEGIKLVHDNFPGVEIFTAAVDKKLNKQKFIVPGIGDYGDRYFGTEG